MKQEVYVRMHEGIRKEVRAETPQMWHTSEGKEKLRSQAKYGTRAWGPRSLCLSVEADKSPSALVDVRCWEQMEEK